MNDALALLALLSLPAIVVLHLFRRTREKRVVSALFLWRDARELSPSQRRIQPLRKNLSLLLELLAATALAFALAGPQTCTPRAVTHLLAVLDDSASMSAIVDGSSAADRVREALSERIATHGEELLVTLIASGNPPRLLCGPRASVAEARLALANYAPSAAHHDLAPAIALARSGWNDSALLLFSDQGLENLVDAEVEVHALGRAASNWAILRAERKLVRDHAQRETVHLTLASFATAPAELTVEIARDGSEVPLLDRRVKLEAGAQQELVFELDASTKDLHIALQRPAADALEIDDHVHVPYLPPREPRLFLNASAEDLRALRLEREGGERFDPVGLGAAKDFATSSETCDLYLGRGAAPPTVASALCWDTPGAQRTTWTSPFLIESAEPLLHGVPFATLQWTGDPEWRPPGTALMRAGDVVLISIERRGPSSRLYLNCDPERSTLGASADWPVLLANFIALRKASLAGPAEALVRLGQAPHVMGLPGRRYTWADPHRGEILEITAAANGTLALPRLDHIGVAELRAVDADPAPSAEAESWHIAAALLDEHESDLRFASSGTRGTGAVEPRDEATDSTATTLLAVLFFAFVMCNWYWLARQRGRNSAKWIHRPDALGAEARSAS